jgi:hypothetical protein
MLSVDRLLGSIVATLEIEGVLDDTYILFTSDNGFHLGEHRLGLGKQTAYDEDIHVPFVARGPGIDAGTANDALALNTDLAPTFAAIAETPAAAFVDGRSLLPLLEGPVPAEWRSAVLVEHTTRREVAPTDGATEAALATGSAFIPISGATSTSPSGSTGSPAPIPADIAPVLQRLAREFIPSYAALRGTDFLYVEWASGFVELYDHRVDPYELDNAADRVAPSTIARLHEQLEALRRCSADSCREWEDRAVSLGDAVTP